MTWLPQYISDLDLSGNVLTGTLPAIIGGDSSRLLLRFLKLQHNKFTGRVSGRTPQVYNAK
jgi:hypothetical protein